MTRLLVLRSLRGVITLVLTIVFVFVLLRWLPADPATMLMGDSATPEQIAEARTLWGLDRPMTEQFLVYVTNLARGNAGYSFQYLVAGQPAIPAVQLVMSRIPATLVLSVTALVLAIAVSIPLGVITALKSGSLLDNAVLAVTLTLTSFPGFFVGMVLILVFGLGLKLLPTGGIGTPQHLVLPSITLALPFIVILTRVTRTEMGRILQAEYIRTARAKGLSGRTVLFRHALRNALIPLVTLIGLRLGGLLNGAVIVETLFRWPGVGSLMIQSIAARDYPVVQVLVPYAALIFIVSNFVVDVIYAVLDPRVRFS